MIVAPSAAVVVFVIVAIIGLIMAVMHLRGKPPRLGLVRGHGVLAAVGIVLMVVSTALLASAWAGAALALFILTALAGLTMASAHAEDKKVKGGVIVGHAALGILATALVLTALLAGWLPA